MSCSHTFMPDALICEANTITSCDLDSIRQVAVNLRKLKRKLSWIKRWPTCFSDDRIYLARAINFLRKKRQTPTVEYDKRLVETCITCKS